MSHGLRHFSNRVSFLWSQLFYRLEKSSKSYPDVVSGLSLENESASQPFNTFWRTYQMEDKEDAMKRAIANSMVSDENLR